MSFVRACVCVCVWNIAPGLVHVVPRSYLSVSIHTGLSPAGLGGLILPSVPVGVDKIVETGV